MGKIPDRELFNYLHQGDRVKVNEAIKYLYRRLFGKVAKYVRKYQGSSQDVEDIFQDGLLAFYRLIKRDALRPDIDMEAYFFTICKNLWLQKLRKATPLVDAEEDSPLFKMKDLTLFTLMKKEEQEELKRLMGLIGEACRQILVSYYYKRFRMQEIAKMMGYASDQVAKNKKSECMKKLKTLALKSPVFKDKTA